MTEQRESWSEVSCLCCWSLLVQSHFNLLERLVFWDIFALIPTGQKRLRDSEAGWAGEARTPGCQACVSGLLSSSYSKVSRTLQQKLHWLQHSVSHGSVFFHCCVRVLLGFMMQVDYISPSDPSDKLNCSQTAVLLGNPTRTSLTLGGMWILPSSLKTHTNRRYSRLFSISPDP